MSQENQDEEAGKGPPKKRVTALVLVVAGAIAGGAGVVLLTPAQPAPEPAAAVSQEAFEWIPADVELDFRFNPQTGTGKSFGQVSFTVAFVVQPGKLQEAKDSVGKRLTQARSRCLELLSSQTVEELQSPDGKKRLKRLLMDELTYGLFPERNGQRVATVENIFWTSFLIQ